MKILLKNGERREQLLGNALMGLSIREVTLTCGDMAALRRMPDEHKIDILSDLSLRFGPSSELDADSAMSIRTGVLSLPSSGWDKIREREGLGKNPLGPIPDSIEISPAEFTEMFPDGYNVLTALTNSDEKAFFDLCHLEQTRVKSAELQVRKDKAKATIPATKHFKPGQPLWYHKEKVVFLHMNQSRQPCVNNLNRGYTHHCSIDNLHPREENADEQPSCYPFISRLY